MTGPDDRNALFRSAQFLNGLLRGIEPLHYPWPKWSDEWMVLKLRQIGFFAILYCLLALVILFGGDE